MWVEPRGRTFFLCLKPYLPVLRVGVLWSSLCKNGWTDLPQIFTVDQAHVGWVPFAIGTLIASS